MTDPIDWRSFWGELHAGMLRAGPRLESWWGSCPVCYMHASTAARFGGLYWGACLTCMTRWLIRDLPPELELDDLDDDAAFIFATTLADCTQLDPAPEISPAFFLEDTRPMRNTTTPSEQMSPFDPWESCPPATDSEAPDQMPYFWERFSVPERAEMGAACLKAIKDFPGGAQKRDALAVAHRAWTIARANPTLENKLCRMIALSNPVSLFHAAIKKLLTAGDELTLLRKRRDDLDKQIEILESRRGERVAS